MAHQYKREPLTADEANRLANTCESTGEKLAIWTLLDTGLRVAELAILRQDNIDWQGHRLPIYGKGRPYGKKTQRRVVPLPPRVQPLIEGHFALYPSLGMTPRAGAGMAPVMRTLACRHTGQEHTRTKHANNTEEWDRQRAHGQPAFQVKGYMDAQCRLLCLTLR